MKKIKRSIFFMFIAFAALSFTPSNLNAQSFEKGDFDLNAQIGFGTRWYYSYTGTGYKMGLPFISVAGDYALVDTWGPGVFGVGALIGINTYKFEYFSGTDWKETNFSIVPRATYHYQFVDRLDTYGGLATGFKIRSFSGTYLYTPSNSVDFVFTAFVGAKYYFTENFSVMSEIFVYDLALFNIGVGFKF